MVYNFIEYHASSLICNVDNGRCSSISETEKHYKHILKMVFHFLFQCLFHSPGLWNANVFFPIFELYSRYFEKMFDSCFVQGCSWSENKITKKQLKPSPPLSKWSFFTCFDGVQKQSENNFHGKISEIIKITDKKIIPGCKL